MFTVFLLLDATKQEQTYKVLESFLEITLGTESLQETLHYNAKKIVR